mmetsp:Transcript_22552/g.67157  ORF Transcript_22552/g.67157 Transcript_22552/m.67157 type:complete len:222 (-) Transcript_22552:85-750(-)|eukprot:365509-Chlamydomonas_euryale.AAC.32
MWGFTTAAKPLTSHFQTFEIEHHVTYVHWPAIEGQVVKSFKNLLFRRDPRGGGGRPKVLCLRRQPFPSAAHRQQPALCHVADDEQPSILEWGGAQCMHTCVITLPCLHMLATSVDIHATRAAYQKVTVQLHASCLRTASLPTWIIALALMRCAIACYVRASATHAAANSCNDCQELTGNASFERQEGRDAGAPAGMIMHGEGGQPAQPAMRGEVGGEAATP